jgi:Holliday junction resolvase
MKEQKKEQKIQKDILDYLDDIGAYQFKVIIANKRGVPDVFAFLNGNSYAIEVKKRNETVPNLQLANIELLKKQGVTAFVARSVEDVKKWIK